MKRYTEINWNNEGAPPNHQEDAIKFLGHVDRKEALEEPSVGGNINGKLARGGQRDIFLCSFNIKPPRRLWDLARDRQQWRYMVRQTSNW